MANNDDLRTCPAGCGRDDLRGAQGVATHLSRRHPDYDPGEAAALDRAEQQDEGTTLELSVHFPPDELVLLQALVFLRGDESLNDLAAAAFDDLFAWAREQEAVQALLAHREAWRGALVDETERPSLTVVDDVTCGAACSEGHTYIEGECEQFVAAPAEA